MIDRFGNQIIRPDDENPDPVMVKNEVRFMMKGFLASSSDSNGKRISIKGEWLSARLDKHPNQEEVLRLLEQVILAMDTYCRRSTSTDIPWYMGWLCRNLHFASHITKRYRTEAFDDIGYSVKFFERYREVQPTNQGKNILVNVYTVQATALLRDGNMQAVRQALEAAKERRRDPGDPDSGQILQQARQATTLQVLEILEKARACEESIAPDYARHNRFAISETLYSTLYDVYAQLRREQEAFEAVRKAVGFSLQNVRTQPTGIRFKRLCDLYHKYAEHEMYDFASDPWSMDEAIELMEAYSKRSFLSPLKSHIDKLKRLRSQFQP